MLSENETLSLAQAYPSKVLGEAQGPVHRAKVGNC